MASSEKIETQILTPLARSNGAMLEDAYEAGSSTGDCSVLRDQLSKISDSDREAALVNMAAANLGRRKTNPGLPLIELSSSKDGGTEFKFPACSKTSFAAK